MMGLEIQGFHASARASIRCYSEGEGAPMIASLVSLIVLALRAVEIAVIGAVVASLLDIDPDNPIVRALRSIADPLLRAVKPIARRIPGPFDWSPMIVLLGIDLLRGLLSRAIQ